MADWAWQKTESQNASSPAVSTDCVDFVVRVSIDADNFAFFKIFSGKFSHERKEYCICFYFFFQKNLLKKIRVYLSVKCCDCAKRKKTVLSTNFDSISQQKRQKNGEQQQQQEEKQSIQRLRRIFVSPLMFCIYLY